MPTKERVAEVYATRELKRDHHPFLDEMRKFFPPEKFARVLAATKEQYGTYSPSGDVPVWDSDVLKKVDTVVAAARANYPLSSTQERDIRAAAHFAIWAHGTDTKFEKKRFRHERKADGSFQPYAIHFARVAERLTDFDPITLQIAFLHDVLENTRYTEENLEDIFGSDIARTCKKVSKISSDSIEDMLSDLNQVELGVARDYLNQFRYDGEIERIVEYLDEQIKQSAYYRNITVGHFESFASTQAYFKEGKLIFEALKEHVSGEDEAQMLSLIRLLSLFEKEEDVRALIVKCADSADNMTTIQSLAEGRGREKAESKARIANSVFAPLARVLGLDGLALEIESSTFPVLEPKAAIATGGKLNRLHKIDSEAEAEIQSKIDQFVEDFLKWANDRSSQRHFLKEDIYVALRYPEASEIRHYEIAIKSKISPLWEIYIRDKFTARAFYDFLTVVATDIKGKVVANKVMNVFGDRVRRANLRLTALRSNRDLVAMIYDSSGDIIDLFRPNAPLFQKFNAADKLRTVLIHLKSGDFSDFLADLRIGRTIKIMLSTTGSTSGPTELYIPNGATIEDALILSGNGRKKARVVRDGVVVEAHDLQPGDILQLETVTDRIDSLYHPATMDRLTTTAARIRLKDVLMDIINRDIAYYLVTKEGVLLGAKFRGIRILAILSDIYAASLIYRSHSNQPYQDIFFRSLLASHRNLVGHILNDEFLINLGLTPLTFPTNQSDLTAAKYNEWMELPQVTGTLDRLMRWVHENCYEVRPSNWHVESETVVTSEINRTLAEYLKRLSEGFGEIIREIIFIPVREGQIDTIHSFYIAIDPLRLDDYARRMGINREVALNRLFDSAHKVITKYR